MNRNGYTTGPFEKDRYWKLFLSRFYPERYRKMAAVDSTDHLNAIPHLERIGVLPPGSELLEEKRYRSSTGELELDGKNTTFRAVTPCSEGFLLEEGRTLHGRFAQIRNRKNFCAVPVAAVDGRALKESERLLLLHLTDSKNSEMVFSDAEMQIVEEFGKLPLLVRKGIAELTIHRKLDGFTLYPVRNDGTRLAPLPMRTENGNSVILLDTARALAYELVKDRPEKHGTGIPGTGRELTPDGNRN